jgi:hypothetical protein
MTTANGLNITTKKFKNGEKMKIFNYNKFPEEVEYKYGDICELSEWDLEKLQNFDEVYYWYAQAPYEGMGQLLGLMSGRWYIWDCGHCSCYGPLDNFFPSKSDGYVSLTEIEKSCTSELINLIKPLLELAKNNTEIESYTKKTSVKNKEESNESFVFNMEKEIREAYKVIRESNTSIPDHVLDFMKDAAIKRLKG